MLFFRRGSICFTGLYTSYVAFSYLLIVYFQGGMTAAQRMQERMQRRMQAALNRSCEWFNQVYSLHFKLEIFMLNYFHGI